MKVTITQALNELKVLDSRINKEIRESDFVGLAKTSSNKINPNKTKEAFSKEVNASFNSINDLIARREIIKNAIIESNANTYIVVCDQKVSVAKAIDMKNSIEYKRSLLEKMSSRYAECTSQMCVLNSSMEKQIDKLAETMYGKENKNSVKPDEYNVLAKTYRENNEYSLVDPVGIKNQIDYLSRYIEEFESNVDSLLQISNCKTEIDI